MDYPLNLSFKLLAIGRQVSVTDSTGRLVFYVKQKAFKLKEAVTVFGDAQQTMPLYTINADRIIDFSARYNLADHNGFSLGAVRRQGMKSLWKAHYDILNGDGPGMSIHEENPWTKLLDGLLGQVPVIGMFTGYFLHPSYLVSGPGGAPVMRLKKMPAFFEGKFRIERLAALSERDEIRVLLSLMMLVLLERSRG